MLRIELLTAHFQQFFLFFQNDSSKTSEGLVELWPLRMDISKQSPDLLIKSLAGGDMDILDQIYDRYRDDFLGWIRSKFPSANRDDMVDVWHDTMIMFYEQVRDRKLTHLTCELKSFLFLIGYRRMIKIHHAGAKTEYRDEWDANIQMDESINAITIEDIHDEQHQMLALAVETLPEQSRKILTMRYVEGKSVPEIMQLMGYTSVNAVSVTLSRSLKKLRETIEERMQSNDTWKKEMNS